MKNLILSLFLLLSSVAASQTLPNYWVPTSGTDTYSTYITTFGSSSYANKIAYVKFGNTNTGASTLQINGIVSPPALRMYDGDSWEPLTAGQIDVNTVYKVAYNGSYWQMESFGTGGGGGDQDLQSVLDNGSTAEGDLQVLGTGTTIGVEVSAGTATLGQVSGSAGGAVITDEDGIQLIPDKAGAAPATGNTYFVTGSGHIEARDIVAGDLPDAAADGTTKGAATFTAADFNASAGLISLDYTNGQAASGSNKGFLTAADWTTFSNKQDIYPTTNTQTTNYTAALTDAGKFVEFNSASGVTFTIPPSGTTDFPDNTQLTVHNLGAGVVTLTAGSGVTFLNNIGGTLTIPQYSVAVVKNRSANDWYVWNSSTVLGAAPTSGRVPYANGSGKFIDDPEFSYNGTTDILTVSRVLLAGETASSNTGPIKNTVGTLMTTIEAGASGGYDGDYYDTNNSLNRFGRGGPIADFFADVSNTGTGETDLLTYTTKASTLSETGDKLAFDASGTFNDNTATAQVRFYYGGTLIGNTGALTVSTTGGWVCRIVVIRTGASTARAQVNITTPTATTTVYAAETDVTGLTFTNTNIIKITGTAGGGGGGTGDITAKMGTIIFWPAAKN